MVVAAAGGHVPILGVAARQGKPVNGWQTPPAVLFSANFTAARRE
jgi:hypothetical protein